MAEKSEIPSKQNRRIRTVLLIVLAVCLFWALRHWQVHERLTDILDWVSGLGMLAPFVFILIYIIATVVFLPGSLLTLGAGVLFGVLRGFIFVSVASTLGATAAFLLGRYFARGWIAGKIESNAKFKAIDEGVAREGWKIVLLTRLSPVFPFNLLNYAFGLTRVSLKNYFWSSWIGMMPGTVMYVYLGAVAGNLVTLGAGEPSRTPAEWALYIVGLMATIGVTVYITRIARNALNRKVSGGH